MSSGNSFRAFAVAAAILASFVQPMAADSHERDYAASGGYIGGGLALGFENFSTGAANYDTGVGLDFWAGGRFARFLAIEGQIQWIPGIKVSGTSLEFKPLVYTGNVKGYLPLGRFQPFALIGIGGMRLDGPGPVDPNDFIAKFGAGLEFYITEQLAAVTSWNYILGTGVLDGADLNTLSFAAQFKF